MAEFLTTLKKMNAGEKRFATLLNSYLDDDYLIWFDAPTQGKKRRYPDFLIFHPRHGLLCIEVKDWALRNLTELTNESVVFGHGDSRQVRTHPLRQARECLLSVIEVLQSDDTLLQKQGDHQGKLAVPWGYGAVMWGWKRDAMDAKMRAAIASTFPESQTFFKEDLDITKISQAQFIQKLHGLFPYRLQSRLTDAQAEKVRGYIFPEFIIDSQGDLFADDTLQTLPDIVHVMDIQQEMLARNMGDGHRVIHGVAGSGKTVILEHRARKLATDATADKPVLVLCYNVVLAARLRARLAHQHIEVHHFHGWCGEMKARFGLDVAFNKDRYFDDLAESVCSAIADGRIPSGIYHAVLIDEGHDFAAPWLRAVATMPDATHEHLLLLYDDAQTIYDNRRGIGFTLSSVGIKAQGRTSILRINYRNSREILNTAERFISHFLTDGDTDEDGIPLLSPQASGRSTGIEPIFSAYIDRQAEFAGIVERIATWQAAGVALGDIAVLYYRNDFAKDLARFLALHHLPVQFLIDKKAKENYRPVPDKITLCSIASSKGSEFSHVIVSGIGQCHDSAQRCEHDARLIYVGMTRAIDALVVTAHDNNAFTALLAE